jgi:hypothetical protein
MKSNSFIIISLLSAMVIGACANDTNPKNEASDTPSTKQTLTVSGDCTFAVCGVVPTSLSTEAKVTCENSTDAVCDWSASGSGTASYRFCSDAECPEKPAIECPEGTVFASQSCGSENDAACAWTTTCAPPRDTTPCPETTGCDSLPLMAIGIVCKDGSVGGTVCVTDGQTCHWERNCD